jgi:hypothetical protein
MRRAPRQPSRDYRWTRWLACLTSPVALVACSEGQLVTLGERAPYHFEPPVLVAELGTEDNAENPTLTADLLELYFTTSRVSDNGDVWVAKRQDANAPFDAPEAVSAVNTDSFETSAAISSDGLTLWWGSERDGGLGAVDIWVTERSSRDDAWSEPSNVMELNSPARDAPRPLGAHDTLMPLSSDRAASSLYQTYLARRQGTGFAAPERIEELAFSERSVVDGFLSQDGEALFYSSGPVDMPQDLYVALRRGEGEPFLEPIALDDLNTAADERDPWLSPDGKSFFFTSDRGGTLVIYRTTLSVR